MIAAIGRAATIFENDALEAAIVRLAHRRVHAHIRRDAGQHDVANAAGIEDQLEIGSAERSLAGLVDDDLAGQWRKLRDNVPAGFAAHEDASAWPGVTDAGADLARAPALVRRQIGKVRPMAFARMDDVIAAGAHGRHHGADRLDRRTCQRQIVAHRVDIAADAAKVGLHVDDDERRRCRSQTSVEWPRVGSRADREARVLHLRHRIHSAASRCASPNRRVGAGKPQDVPSVTFTSSSHGRRYWPATMSCMNV